MRNTRWRDVLISALFMAFLLTALVVGLLRDVETYSYYENRNLAQKPALTAESMASGEYFTKLDSYLADRAPGRNTLLKLDTFIDLKVLRLPVVNEVVVTDDILLPFNNYEMFDVESIPGRTQRITENLTAVNEVVEANGGRFYYIAVPCQYAYFEDEYPWYLNNNADYTRESRAALSAALESAGVGYMDIGEVFDELGHPMSLGSTVDNHYPLYGAYLAYETIMDRVNADTGLAIPVLREGDFTIRELPNLYVGSRMRKLFNLWNNGEKLAYIIFNEEIPFTRSDYGSARTPYIYTMPSSQWEWLTYSFYMGGDISETVIDTGREELPSILIYGDSFTNAIECVAWYSFNEMRSLDLRHYSEMTLGEYIETYKPDIVICIRDYEALLSTDSNGRGPNG